MKYSKIPIHHNIENMMRLNSIHLVYILSKCVLKVVFNNFAINVTFETHFDSI